MKNMKKIVIRVDSSQKIGSGHFIRCLTLAKKLKKEYGAEIYFICRNLDGNLNYLTAENNFILHELPRSEKNFNLKGYESWLEVPQNIDASETSEILRQLGRVDRLIVDSYALDIN